MLASLTISLVVLFSSDSLFKLGEIYRVEGNTEKALIFYLRAKEEYPDSGAAQLAKKSEEILKEQSNLVE